MPAKQRNPRRGLQRLTCDACSSTVYATWHQVESHPLPVCGGCGARYVPEDLNLAAIVLERAELEAHPWHEEYVRQLRSVDHGQASHVQRSRQLRPAQAIAAERVAKARAEDARARQLSGLRGAGAVPEDIPF